MNDTNSYMCIRTNCMKLFYDFAMFRIGRRCAVTRQWPWGIVRVVSSSLVYGDLWLQLLDACSSAASIAAFGYSIVAKIPAHCPCRAIDEYRFCFGHDPVHRVDDVRAVDHRSKRHRLIDDHHVSVAPDDLRIDTHDSHKQFELDIEEGGHARLVIVERYMSKYQ